MINWKELSLGVFSSLLILLGILLTLLLQNFFKKFYKWFLNRAPLIKRYWIFSIPFFVVALTIYCLLYKYSASDQLVNISGQIITLIFAIYVGYLAFLQVNINRIDSLKVSAREELKDGSYPRAVKLYEELFSINSKDFYALAELLEAYLIQKDYASFNEKLIFLKRNSLSNKEKKTELYLEFALQLFQFGEQAASKNVREAVDRYSNTQRDFFWDFEDIKDSDMYKSLLPNTRRMFENFTQYLNGTLDLDLIEEFEKGNFCVSREIQF